MSQVVSDTNVQTKTPDRLAQLRRVVVIVLLVYVVLFVALNRHRVEISFVFFSVHTLTLVALAVVAVLSFGAGFLAHGRRAKRKTAGR